jgi:hypothetical protein
MKRLLALFMLLVIALPLLPLGKSSAATISESGSRWVTIEKGSNRQTYLRTTSGNTLGGNSWEYTTDDGISGGAFCLDWGKNNAPSGKSLPLTGKYTANPKVIGASAGGYPQRPLEDFIAINVGDYPELASLTIDEYAYASQVAIWAALGQVGVSGTAFTSGRATVAYPQNAQEERVYRTVAIILWNADFWTKPQETGLTVRLANDNPNTILDIQETNGIMGAVEKNLHDIRLETVDGVDYYTRTFTTASATSTYKHDYNIEIWLENAPDGA